nr:hypothetical protein [Tanacetum cinerariifolium]
MGRGFTHPWSFGNFTCACAVDKPPINNTKASRLFFNSFSHPMKSTLRNRMVRGTLSHSLIPLAWCASVGVALGAPTESNRPADSNAPLAMRNDAPLADIVVQGIVTDTKGEGLPGVNVI